MIHPNSIGTHLTRFKDHQETATIKSALRIVYPDTNRLSNDDRIDYFNRIPFADLRGKMNEDMTGWSPVIAGALEAQDLMSDTYQKVYPRAIRRFIERGQACEPDDAPEVTVLPEWLVAQTDMNRLFPESAEHLRRVLKAGITTFGTYQAADQAFAVAWKRIQNIRSCFNRLARECSDLGLTPKDFGLTVVIPQNFSLVPMLKGHEIAFYNARMVWNAIVEADPALGLPFWGERKKLVSLPQEAYPDQLIQGYHEAMFEGRSRSANTVESYWGSFNTFLGVLESEGISLMRLTKGLGSRDALRLVKQGFPREFLTNDAALDDPYVLARRLVDDHAFRDQVIERMRSLEGAYEGLESIVNPFVAIALKVRREHGNYSANRQLLMRVSFVNNEYLCIRERHYRWIKDLLAAANKAEEDNETDYDFKKREAFQHPDTWQRLWNSTQGVIADLLEQAVTPTLNWAHKVADVALFTVMLLYPMRREQFNMMLVSPVEPGQYADSQLLLFHRKELAKKKELKANFHPDTYEITFSKIETKNDKAIHYVIPERGRGELARKLIDVYMTVARPIMLQDRRSPYMFVPQKRNRSGIHLRKAALNDILPSLCKKYFETVLPPDLMEMNPHLIRHVVASYALVIRKSLALAAMLLNDEPETVLSYYSDVLQSSRDELRKYHEMDDDAPKDEL